MSVIGQPLSPPAPAGVETRTSGLVVVVPPAALPVTAAAAIAHLRLAPDTDAAYLELLIAAATAHAEDAMECSLMPRTLTATYYDDEPLRLRRGPLLELLSVAGRGDETSAGYELRHAGHAAFVVLTTDALAYPISVTYRAGYESAGAVPADVRLAILAHVGTLYENRESASDKAVKAVPHHLDDFYRLKRRSAVIK